jgi:hypothetical protein
MVFQKPTPVRVYGLWRDVEQLPCQHSLSTALDSSRQQRIVPYQGIGSCMQPTQGAMIEMFSTCFKLPSPSNCT